jgi:hypothetical protein
MAENYGNLSFAWLRTMQQSKKVYMVNRGESFNMIEELLFWTKKQNLSFHYWIAY